MAAITELPRSGKLVVANPYRAQEAAQLGAKMGLNHFLHVSAPRDTLYTLDLDGMRPSLADFISGA